jgi:hypothetical protein
MPSAQRLPTVLAFLMMGRMMLGIAMEVQQNTTKVAIAKNQDA